MNETFLKQSSYMAQIQMLMLVEVSVAAELVLHGTPVELVLHGTPLALEVSVAEKLVPHATSLEVSVAEKLVLHATSLEVSVAEKLVPHAISLEVSVAEKLVLHAISLEVSVAEKLFPHAISLEVSVAVEAVDVHETPLPFSSFSYSYQMLTQSCCLSLLCVSFFLSKTVPQIIYGRRSPMQALAGPV